MRSACVPRAPFLSWPLCLLMPTFAMVQAHPYLEGIVMPSKEVNLADERMVGEPSPEELRGAIRSISSAL